jgi:hypothetical protein
MKNKLFNLTEVKNCNFFKYLDNRQTVNLKHTSVQNRPICQTKSIRHSKAKTGDTEQTE